MAKYTRAALISIINEEKGDLQKAAKTLGIGLRWLQQLIKDNEIVFVREYK